ARRRRGGRGRGVQRGEPRRRRQRRACARRLQDRRGALRRRYQRREGDDLFVVDDGACRVEHAQRGRGIAEVGVEAREPERGGDVARIFRAALLERAPCSDRIAGGERGTGEHDRGGGCVGCERDGGAGGGDGVVDARRVTEGREREQARGACVARG